MACLFLPSFLKVPLPSGPVNDKFFHFLVYLVAGFVVMRGACLSPMGERPVVAICFAFLLTAAVGVVDEVHQLFVPGRQMDRLDLLCDLAGSAVGIGIYLVFRRKKNQNP